MWRMWITVNWRDLLMITREQKQQFTVPFAAAIWADGSPKIIYNHFACEFMKKNDRFRFYIFIVHEFRLLVVFEEFLIWHYKMPRLTPILIHVISSFFFFFNKEILSQLTQSICIEICFLKIRSYFTTSNSKKTVPVQSHHVIQYIVHLDTSTFTLLSQETWWQSKPLLISSL